MDAADLSRPNLILGKVDIHGPASEACEQGGGLDFLRGVGSSVIEATTKRLIERLFDCADNDDYRRSCILMRAFSTRRIIESMFYQPSLRKGVRLESARRGSQEPPGMEHTTEQVLEQAHTYPALHLSNNRSIELIG